MTLRPRRLRTTAAIRRAVAETTVAPSDLIAPLFVKEGLDRAVAIPSLPGQMQHGLESLVKEARSLANDGIAGVMLFGIPADKDEHGLQADAPRGITQTALSLLREDVGNSMMIVADLCLCEYTSHGHCAVMAGGDLDERATLRRYSAIAVAQARAGAHFVAPSGMMDGQVAAIRSALDSEGFEHVGIVSYAAKFASGFYGPFRDAAEGAPLFGDRRGHQLDPANGREAMREIALDIAEGADVVMVKPAGSYLDIVNKARERFDTPLAAYQVSGEYSMLHAAAERGWIDLQPAALETLTSIKRAGADLIVSYFTPEAARWLS